jgi:hypothetical protein
MIRYHAYQDDLAIQLQIQWILTYLGSCGWWKTNPDSVDVYDMHAIVVADGQRRELRWNDSGFWPGVMM